MSEKILVLGDPHFKVTNLETMERVCEEILKKIDELQISMVISLGDTLDTHERIYMPALCAAVKFYKAIAKRVPLVVLIGNHDRINNQEFCTDVHPFVGLETYPNITIVWKPVWDREKNFLYVPYVPNGRLNDALALAGYTPGDKEEPIFLYIHQEMRDSVIGIKVSSHGDPWAPHLPSIISGHIHEYQVVSNITYVGTFLQQNYGETSDKALLMISLDRTKPKGENWSCERIRLSSAPLRTTLRIRVGDLPTIAEKIPPGHLVKVIIYLDATETREIEANPYYKALQGLVDSVVKKVEGKKASIAENMVKEMKDHGALKSSEKGIYRVEEIVRAMLKDDPSTLSLFENEIIIK